jgi:MOSC domain-containing protein YiiM
MSAISKTPVTERIKVNPLGLEGDEQADLSVHGGLSKAIYAYPSLVNTMLTGESNWHNQTQQVPFPLAAWEKT